MSAVLTLRGDCFGHAITDYRPLSDRVQGAQVNLGPMKREELRLAIEEPAKKVWLTFEAGLVDLILEQVGDEPGYLPLVEFVLRRLWEDRQGGELHHAAYKAMGELQGAIAHKADSVFTNLSHEDQHKVQQIFMRLVRPGEGGADTRQRATLRGMGEGTRSLVKKLADERLLVTSQLANTEEETIEVSHEALIHHWGQLKKWLNNDREYLMWQQQLNVKLREWERCQRSSDLLLRGLPLAEALEWLKKKPDYVFPIERRFIVFSKNRKIIQRTVATVVPSLILMLIGNVFKVELKTYDIHQAMLKVQSSFVSIHMEPQMVQINGGIFQRGDVEGYGDSDERPIREVTVNSFALGKYEVTFEEYDRFAITTSRRVPDDSQWGRGRRPVINVSWEDAKAYAQWLSAVTKKSYRLPTESEWEYARRRGARPEVLADTSKKSEFEEYAIFRDNSKDRTSVVGTKHPDDFGLYDMSGNVWEWVEDCWNRSYDAPTNGLAFWKEDCRQHVIRGGSWYRESMDLRPSKRGEKMASYQGNGVGFRLAQGVEP